VSNLSKSEALLKNAVAGEPNGALARP